MNRDQRDVDQHVPLAEATRVWARIGLLGFGGPAGQIALMHRILVDEKGWISETRFLHALNFCMLLPGPEAQQLATYVGWLLHGIRGGLVAGLLFILPGFVVILALSYIYVTAGSLPLVQGLFLGLKAAVVVIVLQALIRIARRSLHRPEAAVLALLAFVAMYAWRVPFPYVILAAALAGALFARFAVASATPGEDAAEPLSAAVGPRYLLTCIAVFGGLWLAPTGMLVATLGADHVFTDIALFFSKMAVVTFGGAYAVLAWVSQEAVAGFGWLTPGEMIDGLAMAETTPGPLIMVVQFVGFLAAWRDPGGLPAPLAALLGAGLTTWVTFAPCFLWIFAGAPYIERLRRNRALAAALAGVTAAVVGVIANLALWFTLHTLFGEVASHRVAGAVLDLPVPGTLQLPALLITTLAAVFVFRMRGSILATLALSGALGVAVATLGGSAS